MVEVVSHLTVLLDGLPQGPGVVQSIEVVRHEHDRLNVVALIVECYDCFVTEAWEPEAIVLDDVGADLVHSATDRSGCSQESA